MNSSQNETQNFITGFILGAIISGGACYLTMTKSGRKIARELLRKAEEIGEEGYEALEEINESNTVVDVKRKTAKKIDGIIDKLKGEVGSLKKG